MKEKNSSGIPLREQKIYIKLLFRSEVSSEKYELGIEGKI
jgi:hypothetical protein